MYYNKYLKFIESDFCREARYLMRSKETPYDNKSAFAVAMLTVLRRTKNCVQKIDAKVNQFAQNAFSLSCTGCALDQIRVLIDLSDAKNDMLYISRICTAVLEKIPSGAAALLTMHFIARNEARNTARLFGISSVVYYKALKTALLKFYYALEAENSGLKWAENILFPQHWFNKMMLLLTCGLPSDKKPR